MSGTPDTPGASNLGNLVLRLLLGVVTALAVSATAYVCAWLEYRTYPHFRDKQEMTRRSLDNLRGEIERYKERTGDLPERLEDLKAVGEKLAHVDGWGRPLQYEVKDGDYDLYSYGMDGKPGGDGLNADLHAGSEESTDELPTIWQFTFKCPTDGILATCLLVGALTFPLCLVYGRGRPEDRLSWGMVLVVHAVTAAFAVGAAVVMSVLHLPSGH